MYHHLRGELVELSPTRAVVEAAGVGYELFIPVSTYTALRDSSAGRDGHEAGRGRDGGNGTGNGAGVKAGATVRVLTHLLVRAEVLRLYGFSSDAERSVFRTVLRISGLGPAAALAILSTIEVGEFRGIVEAGDPTPLQRIKGIGKKLASRLLLELRDRVAELPGPATPQENGGSARAVPRLVERVSSEAVLALTELGFVRGEAEERVQAALRALSAGTPIAADTPQRGPSDRVAALTVEEILREALRR